MDLDALVSQRNAISLILYVVIRSASGGLLFTFLLVSSRALLRNRILAMLAVILIWRAILSAGSWASFAFLLPATTESRRLCA